ncbi:MAG: hypothetical protein AAF483_13395 [Planctomycetota bacterium]
MKQDLAKEIVIAVIDCDAEGERMVFASRTESCEKPIVLRHESFSPDVGWFTQSSVEMTRREMVLLRSAMGGKQPSVCVRTSQKIQAEKAQAEQNQPTILQISKMTAVS